MKAIQRCRALVAVTCLCLLSAETGPAQRTAAGDAALESDGLYRGGRLLGELPPPSEEIAAAYEAFTAVNPQVDIELCCVTFKLTEVENIVKREGSMTAEALMQAWKQGKGKLIGFSKIITQPGEEATVKSTIEYIYPTEYTVQHPKGEASGTGFVQQGSTNTVVPQTASTNAAQQSAVAMPGGFETREVGMIFTVKPEVSPDRTIVSLLLSPDMVREPIWHDYEASFNTDDGQFVKASMKMPFFQRDTATTTVRAHDGTTVIVGGASKVSTKEVVFILATVNLVDTAGNPLPRKAEKKTPDHRQ